MKPDVRPQFRLIGNQLRGVAKDLDSLNMLIAFIEKQVAKGRLSSTRIQVNGGESYPHFCMHRSDDAVVSCSSEQDGVRLLKLLEVEWPQIKAGFENVPIQMKSSTPEINIKMKFKPNDEFRGAAKIAFETAAHLLGVEVVLGEEFDPVRSYICGNLVLPVVNVEMGEIAVDTRFVKRLGDEFTLRFTTKHGVLLLSSPPNLIAFVLLYGTHPYFVHLSKKWVDNLWFRVYEFSHTKDGHQELDELEFARRILSTSPATFGISDEAAKELLEQLRS
jgi:hypothetical protein